ncbi:HalOD1 output domain-containing protein [Haladaptatus sp. GCM10025707]|uniref:HalOD1 output domain-containing protein n=1 Tax=unclassified Haladaptatus TaxID=2622732 RepID=UPI0023E8C2C8|nr:MULTISPECIES: HalOD1 output domain-containing protein [unclassified Haladaptatus]
MNDTVRVTGQRARRPVSELLVHALAKWGRVAPHELDVCIYDYVDPEALDQLFTPPRVGLPRRGTVTVPLETVVATIDVGRDDAVEITIEPQVSETGAYTHSTVAGNSD